MEGTININGKDVKFTLTEDQEALIKNASGKIIDRVKEFEDACAITGDDPGAQKFLIGTPDDIAFQKIKVIVKALNEGWTPDWSDSNQYKYYPWFKYYKGSGFRFLGTYYGITDAFATGGSRLCFESEELAKYAGEQFIDLYNQLLN